MPVSKIDLLNKRFTNRMFGYSKLEVDQFLLETAETMGTLIDSQKELRKKLKRLEVAVHDYRKRDETLRDTLMSTQKMVDDLKVQASREAQLILDEARTKAESTLQKGHHRLAQLHEEIEVLKRQRSQFEIQLKSLLNSHLEMLDYNDPAIEKIEEMESKLTYLKKAE